MIGTVIYDTTKTRSALGQRNRKLVLAEILFGGPIPRAKVAQNVGLTAASVSRITRDLVNAELIEEADDIAGSARAGRKLIGLRAKPDGYFVGGIAINAFRQDVVIADLANKTLACEQLHFDDLGHPERVIESCAVALNALVARAGIERTKLVACGVVITGAVDPSRNILRSAPALGWGELNLDVGAIIARRLRCPVYLDNIPNAKNLASHCFGGTRKVANVVLFNASLAIGCSLMIGGRLMRGADFQTGMIESMLIPDFTANELRPVNQLAGGYAIVNSSAGASDTLAAERLAGIIRHSDPVDNPAVTAIESAGRAFAHVAATAFSILHPEKILLSGPLFECGFYKKAALDQLARFMGARTARQKIQLSPMSSQQAAQSLAIYQSLAQGSLTSPPAPAALAG